MTQDEVFEKVQAAFIEALDLDEDEVTADARIFDDLGAESLDLLEIVFLLERAFDIKIPRGELFPESILTDPQFVQDGKVTPAGLAELRTRMPYADIGSFAAKPNVQDFGKLFTVKMICGYIASKLKA
mgnify:CR=1 FL=1